AASPALKVLASGGADGSVRLWGLPGRAARLGQTAVGRMTLADWEWVRARLREPELPAGGRRALAFRDARLWLRWRDEVHVEGGGRRRPAGEYDVEVEGENY